LLIQSVKKETIIILNDLHSLAVLFLLPITFMLVMTLAMSETQRNLVGKISLKIINPEKSNNSIILKSYLEKSGLNFSSTSSSDIYLKFYKDFDAQLLVGKSEGHLEIEMDSSLSPQTQAFLLELIKVALSKLKFHVYMEEIGDFDDNLTLEQKVELVEKNTSVEHLVKRTNIQQLQNVPTLYSIPSWLIFGIYFIVLPISITLIKEKNNGTLLRIQTYPISNNYYFFNKALSYSIVSCVQWILLALVGFYFVPWVTDQAHLEILDYALFFTAAFFIIFAAISFALLLASMVSTYEQAMVLGGGTNILLAAFSGFMVPVDIMPEALANIATFSPMYWSSELIKYSLSTYSLNEVVPLFLALALFGSFCFINALILFNRKRRLLSWT